VELVQLLAALACFATTATAQTSEAVSPSRVIHLSPAEDSAETRKYWEKRKNAKPQSAEEKARTTAAQAHAESTLAAIISVADSAQGSGKKGSDPQAGGSPAASVLRAIRASRDSPRKGLEGDSVPKHN
jgi:hypothetical protein